MTTPTCTRSPLAGTRQPDGGRAWLAAALAVLAAVAGCGGPPQASVRGRVTLDGEPLAHGTIAFLPADGKGPTAGGLVTAGGYEVRGMAPGLKLIRVEGFDAEVAFPATTAELAAQAAARPRKASEPTGAAGIVPADAAGNNAERELAAGEQVIDVAISRRGAK
ncbi:MAG: hypothetical protein O3A37_12030 [Planctomycetota bacterium]|jgi:hypothetical protein|nr:hypothetical protein [Planctomycetota bacterium]MDA1041002.1 hypothetical protein [Planctomycetota bacterium]